jgi:hypothetical protein
LAETAAERAPNHSGDQTGTPVIYGVLTLERLIILPDGG